MPAYAPGDEVEILDLDALPENAAPQVTMRAPQGAAMPEEPDDGAEASFAFSEIEEDDEGGAPAAAQPGLTLERVIGQWEMVKKACKTKTPKLAALLNSASPVAVTGAEASEVVLQVEYDFHYKKLLEPESRSVIEWALKEILQVSCRCRFLLKDEPIPVSTVVAPAPASQPGPARPPAPRGPQAAPNGERPADAQATQNGHSRPAQAMGKAIAAQASAPPADPLETKVRQDPIVGEIIKTYGAKLVEWKPLDPDM